MMTNTDTDDRVTMADYLDPVDEEQGQSPSPEPDNVEIDTTPRCDHCGKEFDKRGYWLNLHEAHCEERDQDAE